jgi:hypothetical protein
MNNQLDIEIDRNLFAFLPQLSELLPEHEGSFALLRNQRIEGIHKKLSEALNAGYSLFSDGLFSIQKITDRPLELGMFGHADHSR